MKLCEKNDFAEVSKNFTRSENFVKLSK